MPFRVVDETFRGSLSTQLSFISDALTPQLRRTGGAPIRVQLISRAFAKSHRPNHLFSEKSCPIIGAGRLGELFLMATPQGLEALRETIEQNTAKQIEKDLSTVEAIEVITPAIRRRRKTAREVLQKSPRVGTDQFLTQVRLFDFGLSGGQDQLFADFENTCRSRNLDFSQLGYSPQSHVYAVSCRNEDDVEALSRDYSSEGSSACL
jgi:hypothetical protein